MSDNQELINQLVERNATRLIDFHQRRMTNAADAVNPQDYVTLAQVQKLGVGGSTTIVNKETVIGGSGSGAATPPTMILYCLGDSLTVGFPLGGTYQTYPAQLQSKIAVKANNLGINGAQTTAILSAQVPLALGTTGLTNIAIVIGGRNDIDNAGYSSATTQGKLTSIVTALHAAGFLVILGTIGPSTALVVSQGTFNANRASLNSWILGNGPAADLIIDPGNDLTISDVNNTDYWQSDKIHMTALGYSFLARHAGAGIQILVSH